MKKLTSILLFVVMVCFASVAGAGENVNATEPLFQKNEVTAKAFGTYTLDSDRFGAGVGVSVFPLQKYLGFEASTLYEDDGTPVLDNVAGSAILRLPVESLRVAPYGIGTVRYNANQSDVSYAAGGGVEFRVKRNVALFGDVQRLFDSDENQARVGVGFSF